MTKMKMFDYPLFTLLFYSHSPSEYEKLRKKTREEMVAFWKYDKENRDFYERNKQMAELNLVKAVERRYPSILYWNDIAGFISIKIENPIEGYRVVGEVWSIKNKRFKTNRVYRHVYGCRQIMGRDLVKTPQKFNKIFFDKVEEILNTIKKEFIDKRKFYFNL